MPFLKSNKDKQQSGVIVQTRKPDESPETSEDGSAGIEACAHEMIRCMHAKDASGLANALKDAFEILDSMPHEEAGEYTSKHDYDAQNIKAAKE